MKRIDWDKWNYKELEEQNKILSIALIELADALECYAYGKQSGMPLSKMESVAGETLAKHRDVVQAAREAKGDL